jgi:hypothetical protein
VSAHAPWPWSIDKWGAVKDANGENVRAEGLTLTSTEQARANSRLIAAAPELLADAKEALSILCHLDEPIPYERIEECIESIRASIAKVEAFTS